MKLAEWMTEKGLNDAAVGALLAAAADKAGVKVATSRVSISRYRRELEDIPGPTVKLFVEISEGACTANELLGIKLEAAE